METLLTWWEKIAAERPCDIAIGGNANPYMLRWYIIPRNTLVNVYLHRFIRDDDDRALHDHPWESFSTCLSGRLREIDANNPEGRVIGPGDTRHRAAGYAHRLIVEEQGYTLFMTGPKLREWGFLCPQGWRHWERYAAGVQGEVVGAGCEGFGDPAEEAKIPRRTK